jgi:hypothetical protein
LKEFRIYQWLRSNTVDRLSTTFSIPQPSSQPPIGIEISNPEEVWKERKEAESAIKSYLSELPSKEDHPSLLLIVFITSNYQQPSLSYMALRALENLLYSPRFSILLTVPPSLLT